MKEKLQGNGWEIHTVHLERFSNGRNAVEEAKEIIQQNPEISKGELFRQISAGKSSSPKSDTHASRYQNPHFDYKLKGS